MLRTPERARQYFESVEPADVDKENLSTEYKNRLERYAKSLLGGDEAPEIALAKAIGYVAYMRNNKETAIVAIVPKENLHRDNDVADIFARLVAILENDKNLFRDIVSWLRIGYELEVIREAADIIAGVVDRV